VTGRARLRKGSPAALVRDAAMRVGAAVEFASADRCYVTAPAGKAWAVDPECHVLMVLNAHPDDFKAGLGWIEMGLVDCPAPGCEFCGRLAAAQREADLRVGLDSACL
jgi:hypothetical protein